MAVTALFLPKLCLKSPGASREEEREVGGGREVWEEPWRTIEPLQTVTSRLGQT